MAKQRKPLGQCPICPGGVFFSGVQYQGKWYHTTCLIQLLGKKALAEYRANSKPKKPKTPKNQKDT